MKKLITITLFIALIFFILQTNFWYNSWNLLTGRGYIIPKESSISDFTVIEMNRGSGEWWLYGEDDMHYYSMMKESKNKPYIKISKVDAKKNQDFDKMNYKTWNK